MERVMNEEDIKFQAIARELETILNLRNQITQDPKIEHIAEERFANYQQQAHQYDEPFFALLRTQLEQETKRYPRVIVSVESDYPPSMKLLHEHIHTERVREYMKEGLRFPTQNDAIAVLISKNDDPHALPFVVTVVWYIPDTKFLSDLEKKKCTDRSTLLVYNNRIPPNPPGSSLSLKKHFSSSCGSSSSSSRS